MDVRRIQKTEDDYIKEAMHEMPYGIYVIGTTRDDRPNGMIADWVMQVSFEPRLVACAFERDSSSLQRIRDHGFFTVNLLPATDGLLIAQRFVQPANAAKVKGRSETAAAQTVDKLAGIDHRPAEHAIGCPILEDAVAYLECAREQVIEVGDHVLVIGRVLYGEVQSSDDPLTSTVTGWSYSG